MNNQSLLTVAAILILLAPWSRADVSEANNDPCVTKKVVVFNRLTCGDYYQTTFTCEHYLSFGESMLLVDGYESFPCFHTYTLQSITYLPSPVSPAVTGLSGPSSICSDCDATYTASLAPDCPSAVVDWYQDGQYLGAGSRWKTIHLVTPPGSTTITATAGGASASVTTTVLEKPSPNNAPPWGIFDVSCPSISPSLLYNANSANTPLGITGGEGPNGGAAVLQDTKCSCTCTGWELKASFRIDVSIYHYDYRINNQADIAAVSAAEAQHVQSFQDCANAIANDYAGMTTTSGTYDDCLNIRTNFINLKTARINFMIAYNQNLDMPGGVHPNLGDSIKAHGGWSP